MNIKNLRPYIFLYVAIFLNITGLSVNLFGGLRWEVPSYIILVVSILMHLLHFFRNNSKITMFFDALR
jgi:uncharacterized integral membrane protein